MSNVRLRAVITVDYDADPASYGTDDPVAMAAVDLDGWNDDPAALLSMVGTNPQITVAPAPRT